MLKKQTTPHAAGDSASLSPVFGNRHMMELDKNESIEALFAGGDLTVQAMVTAMAQSETYKQLFLTPNNPYKFVELNFKHLLDATQK